MKATPKKDDTRYNPMGLLIICWLAIGGLGFVIILIYGIAHPTPVGTTAKQANSLTVIPNDVPIVITQTHEPKGHGRWMSSEEQSAMDDSKTVMLWLEADAPIEAWLKTPTPQLTIRCQEHKTSVYVTTGTSAQPEYGLYQQVHVRWRLDKDKAVMQRWSESTDNDALFAPNAKTLAQRIAKAEVMTFEFTPFNAPPVITTFQLRGLADKLPQVAKACGWK